jgi:hypothetical protein
MPHCCDADFVLSSDEQSYFSLAAERVCARSANCALILVEEICAEKSWNKIMITADCTAPESAGRELG